MKVSNCCGSPGKSMMPNHEFTYEEAGYCDYCGEHCEYIEEGGDLCDRCHKNKAEDLHTCPYSADINGDYETKCNCCPDCEHECCMEI